MSGRHNGGEKRKMGEGFEPGIYTWRDQPRGFCVILSGHVIYQLDWLSAKFGVGEITSGGGEFTSGGEF